MVKEFHEIKNKLKRLKKLTPSNYSKEFILRTDASNTSPGVVLYQIDDDGDKTMVKWPSRKLTKTERRYSIGEKEMITIA